ncbi:MAG: hypothetical protein U0935_05795 [Pirellulales bacterium]
MRQDGVSEFAGLFLLLGIVVIGWLLTFPGCRDEAADHGRRPAFTDLADDATV